jgi:hypothetical protein
MPTILPAALQYTDGTPLPCMCPLDCTCRNPYRLTVCGCSQHYTDGSAVAR